MEAANRMNENIHTRALTPWLHFDWVYKRSRMHKRDQRDLKVLRGFLVGVIDKRRIEMQQSGVAPSAADGFKSPESFGDRLMRLEGVHFTEEDVIGEAFAFMGAVIY